MEQQPDQNRPGWASRLRAIGRNILGEYADAMAIMFGATAAVGEHVPYSDEHEALAAGMGDVALGNMVEHWRTQGYN
jgi:hypothetical protein